MTNVSQLHHSATKNGIYVPWKRSQSTHSGSHCRFWSAQNLSSIKLIHRLLSLVYLWTVVRHHSRSWREESCDAEYVLHIRRRRPSARPGHGQTAEAITRGPSFRFRRMKKQKQDALRICSGLLWKAPDHLCQWAGLQGCFLLFHFLATP